MKLIKLLKERKKEITFFCIFGVVLLYMDRQSKKDGCNTYREKHVSGKITSVQKIKMVTNIRLESNSNLYRYFVKDAVTGENTDSLTKYAVVGDYFERLDDYIRITKNGVVTMWAIDTAAWRCACESYF